MSGVGKQRLLVNLGSVDVGVRPNRRGVQDPLHSLTPGGFEQRLSRTS